MATGIIFRDSSKRSCPSRSLWSRLFSGATGPDALHLLKAYPLFGSGFGTFRTAFLKYQTALVELDFTFAHNDYLELATEVGVVGFLIFSGVMLVAFVRAVRASARDNEWNIRAL